MVNQAEIYCSYTEQEEAKRIKSFNQNLALIQKANQDYIRMKTLQQIREQQQRLNNRKDALKRLLLRFGF